MALFSKPPAKKSRRVASARQAAGVSQSGPPTAKAIAAANEGKTRGKPALEPVHGDISVTGGSAVEWTPAQPAIEVAQANPGLCAVLENATLLYASGQAGQARLLLEQGVASDHDARQSALAWLSLFDVLQRLGDRAAFDQHALQYVVQFERSPPAWDERAKSPLAPVRPALAGGYLTISGRLTAASAAQIANVRKAFDKKVSQARLDLAPITGYDDQGARLLASALSEARRKGVVLVLQRPEKLRAMLAESVRKGRDGGEGAWLLSLELMQWAREQEAFDEQAIDYAVTFEMSPPSWEPPALPKEAETDVLTGEPAADGTSEEAIAWSGVLAGNATAQLGQLVQFAQNRSVVPLDLSAVERIDFVCAGALLNTIDRLEAQRTAIQIIGASPIIRALLLLIGVSPRHFVRKSDSA